MVYVKQKVIFRHGDGTDQPFNDLKLVYIPGADGSKAGTINRIID